MTGSNIFEKIDAHSWLLPRPSGIAVRDAMYRMKLNELAMIHGLMEAHGCRYSTAYI